MPAPFTRGLGSRVDAWTSAMPASIIASVHGGVLPKWLQGSSVTNSVAPRDLSPACRRAVGSACGWPGG